MGDQIAVGPVVEPRCEHPPQHSDTLDVGPMLVRRHAPIVNDVAEITGTNILQIGICIVNYYGLFGEWTDHMKLLLNVAKIVYPNSFVHQDNRLQFDASLPKIANLNAGDNGVGAAPQVHA